MYRRFSVDELENISKKIENEKRIKVLEAELAKLEPKVKETNEPEATGNPEVH